MPLKTTSIKLSETPDMLGETPLWDWRSERLYWVDGVAGLINSSDSHGKDKKSYKLPSKVGSIGLVDGDEERLVVAIADGVYLFDLKTGALEPVFTLPDTERDVRFNDGKVDPYGNFLVGTLTIQGAPKGKLYRIANDGAATVLKTGIAVPNAICFSPDGKRAYFADSLEGCVKLFDYPEDAATLAEPLQVLDTAALGSAPDGACVDTAGNIWVTLVQNGKIARFSPEGKLDEVFDAPVDTPSCVTFGGPAFDILYLTSIKDTGTGRVVSSHPDGGHLFAFKETGFSGQRDYLFRTR